VRQAECGLFPKSQLGVEGAKARDDGYADWNVEDEERVVDCAIGA
jgi:hypothetical protein